MSCPGASGGFQRYWEAPEIRTQCGHEIPRHARPLSRLWFRAAMAVVCIMLVK